VSSGNLTMVLELDLATQLRVYREYSMGGSCVQGEGSGVVFALPDDLRLGAHRGVFGPSSPASLLKTMVLKAELKSMKNILT